MSKNKHFLAIAATTIALIAATAYVAVMQFHYGAAPYFGYDEAAHFYLATLRPDWKFFLGVSTDAHPPLYYLIMRAFIQLGPDPIYARMPTILATIITVPLLFALLRKIRIRTPVALVTTIILAASFPFLDLGVTTRSYSLAILLMLVAIWFWVGMIPGSKKDHPSRGAAVGSLAFFALAFSILYATLFATTALFGSALLLMAIDSRARKQIYQAWIRHSRWPEWLLFILAHLLLLGWFMIGWGAHIGAEVPSHVVQFSLQPGQSVLQFLHHALHLELALFAPGSGLSETVLDLGLLAILLVAVWVTVVNLRKQNYIRAILALTPLLLTVILAILGITGKYPFGGIMRHQYVLFPLLVILLGLALDTAWRWLTNVYLKTILLALVLGFSVYGSVQTLQAKGLLGEAPAKNMLASAYPLLFTTDHKEPLLISGIALYPIYVDRYRQGITYYNAFQSDHGRIYTAHQGWLSMLLPWASYEEFHAVADDGSTVAILKDQYRWFFPPIPDNLFFTHIRGLLKTLGQTRLRIFTVLADPKAQPGRDALSAAVAAHGFTLTEYIEDENGPIWTIEMDTPSDRNCTDTREH